MVALLAAGVASAYTLSYPYFPIPTTMNCQSATSEPQYCVYPAPSTSYSVSPTGALDDYSVWYDAGNSGWGDKDKLMSMCVADWESGSYTYALHENTNHLNDSYRFDYGLMQVNSYGIGAFDPYDIMVSGYYNMNAAYSDVALLAGSER